MGGSDAVLKRPGADEGIRVVGEDSLPGRRLAEMRDFYAYLMRELPAVIDRWRAQRSRT